MTTISEKFKKLLSNDALTHDEKKKIFQELLLRFLEANNFEDFKCILSVYDFENEILENAFSSAIKKDFMNFITFMVSNGKITITKKFIKTAIMLERYEILEYFLHLCDETNITNELLTLTDNTTIIKLLTNKGLNIEYKQNKILNNAKIMYTFGKFIDSVVTNGDIYTLKFIFLYIKQYVETKENNEFVYLKKINEIIGIMANKKDFNQKNNLLNIFYEFLKESEEEEVFFMKNILDSMM